MTAGLLVSFGDGNPEEAGSSEECRMRQLRPVQHSAALVQPGETLHLLFEHDGAVRILCNQDWHP